ncbi:DUF4307 domain-containing protein [Streptomyces sp. NPDC059166]|uniref:DUF4307 domain-containing protein n=1 Tax=Streptomyces sp. NPDC059166 TaxID=3346752 RepID=UPI0036C2FF36
MAAVREATPEGRYGRTRDERADHKLKIVGSVLGVAFLAMVGWFGWDYIAGQDISAEVIKSRIVSDSRAEAHLEVRKERGTDGHCTLRALSEEGGEVGRADYRFDQRSERIDEIVSLRTTSRATAVELTGCASDS